MSYSGYDIEDASIQVQVAIGGARDAVGALELAHSLGFANVNVACIQSRASIDRGFGRCIVLRKHTTSLRKYANITR